MTNPTEIVPGLMFSSFLSTTRKEKVGFFEHRMLVLQVSGQLTIVTADQTISTKPGQMLLVRKNQLAELTKLPTEDGTYQSIVIVLKEDSLRQFALEEKLAVTVRYTGQPNILIRNNDFLQGFFQSILPYVRNPDEKVTAVLGNLKVKEVIQLLLHSMPELKDYLFDFSEQHKIDLEKFMLNNYHFNMSVEKFAKLTGRSVAGFKRDFQKIFDMAPRQWLLEMRLTEARKLIEQKSKKSSAIYLDLGFESLSHFSHAFKRRFGVAPTELTSAAALPLV